MTVDAVACEPQFLDHIAPVWTHLPDRGTFYVDESLVERAVAKGIAPTVIDADALRRTPQAGPQRNGRPTLVASIGDIKVARRMGLGPFAFLEHGAGQCLAPETKVLTADLRYVSVGSLVVGDRLIAFTEEPGERGWRQWQPATVTATQVIKKSSYRLHFADGTTIVSSSEHLWLCRDRQTYEWTKTEHLQDAARWPTRSSKLIKCFDVWDEDRSWGAGYLAAAFDGEGHFVQTTRDGRQSRMIVGFSQKENDMLDLVQRELAERRFRFGLSAANPKTGVRHVTILGGTREVLRFIGTIRPRRLLQRMKPLDNGQMRGLPVELIRSEFIGEQSVVGLETSTGTLIAEGFATHNSYDSRSASMASYPGGPDREDNELFLVPNEYSAQRWRKAYPRARVEVVGSPRLDDLPRRLPGPPIVAISFHGDWPHGVPYGGNALGDFLPVLPFLARAFPVIGHAHPGKGWGERMARLYRRAGIEFVADFDEVCRRASVYVCDNSSTIFEFASTGRPVVLMNASTWQKGGGPGGRFWDWAHVGVNADKPDQLIRAMERALEDRPEDARSREDALRLVYQPSLTGAADRAATAIASWLSVAVAA